jgi:hypothetical protein
MVEQPFEILYYSTNDYISKDRGHSDKDSSMAGIFISLFLLECLPRQVSGRRLPLLESYEEPA